jgi:hypothetical protein
VLSALVTLPRASPASSGGVQDDRGRQQSWLPMIMNDATEVPVPEAGRRFASTHWSVVLAAGQRDSPESEAALATLCRRYWYPLYAYARRRLPDAEQAQDLTQEFFARLLEKNYLAILLKTFDISGEPSYRPERHVAASC